MIAFAVALAVAGPTSVGVGLDEFVVALGRDTVPARRVKLNVENVGEDPHDLVVRRRGTRLLETGDIRPGERRTLRVRLPDRGRYTLFCSIADHEQLGMKARLRVSAR